MFSIWNTFFTLVTDIPMRSYPAPFQWPCWNMLCSLPVSISILVILWNAYVRREIANLLSTDVLLKTGNLDLSWLCLNMMLPSWTNYLLNSSMLNFLNFINTHCKRFYSISYQPLFIYKIFKMRVFISTQFCTGSLGKSDGPHQWGNYVWY